MPVFFNSHRLGEMYNAVFRAKLDRHVLKHCEGLKAFTPDFIAEITDRLGHLESQAERLTKRMKLVAAQDVPLIGPAQIQYDLWRANQAAGVNGRSVLVSAFSEMSLAEQMAHLKERPKFAGQIAGHLLHPVKLATRVLHLPIQAARGVGRVFKSIENGIDYIRYYNEGDLAYSLGEVAATFEDPLLTHNLTTEFCSDLRTASKVAVGNHSAKVLSTRDYILHLADKSLYKSRSDQAFAMGLDNINWLR